MAEGLEIRYDHYLVWEEVVAFLQAATEAFPELVRVDEIGRTPEGRALLCATVTAGGDAETKPGFLVQANVHAPEVAGTTAALYLLKHLLAGYEKDEAIANLLRDVAFFVFPRMNPDGAEYALTTGGPIRSRFTPRYRKNGLYQADVDGDGLVLSMRVADPRGDMKPHPQDPRLMIPREADDTEGPFYFVYTEGFIHDWDGGPIVGAERGADFNRNWAANWRPEHQQWGAGDFPFSEPEMHALAEFVYQHPNLFGLFGFHCGCNAVLRPPSTGSDDDILPGDLVKMKELGRRGEELTGFGLRAVVDYKLDDQKPIALWGHFHDWGYHHLGLHVFEVELGNIYNSSGITTAQYFASDEKQRRDFDLAALKWHDAHPEKGAFVDWRPFTHPQLGVVEIGGFRRHFVACPASEDMAEIAPRCALFIEDLARRRPKLQIVRAETTPVADGIYRVRATIMNTGDLPTQITEMGQRIAHNDPVRVRLEGVEVLSRGQVQEIGHLGRVCGYRDVEWFARGESGAEAVITATAQKAGVAEARVRLG